MNREKLIITRLEEKEVIDPETGEIISEYKHDKKLVGDSGEFYQVYASILGILKDIHPTDIKIFIATWKYATRNNEVALSGHFKKRISKDYNIGLSTINNSITRLVSDNLLIRIGRGTYRINPRYFWKSKLEHRKKTLKYVLEVECKNC